jgi:hypothetical protein
MDLPVVVIEQIRMKLYDKRGSSQPSLPATSRDTCHRHYVMILTNYSDSVRNTIETCLRAGVEPLQIASEVHVTY